uniref:Elongation factor Tu, chloroplastic n=1 Tax=Odontella aurita TaxID=265563 RepID=A0A7S4HIF4_9STRA|mmetsp:Transcript_10505/g.30932  ORF Transcript_10505/g.30932 Transcript_10505/m.30932 type:complete len:480 (+) Transcript_10505:246-1685(+)|eukprot:CAMPEP_0113571956 /NCGR_PEP_ID=MMETSP0015_2-20120614/25838_1 /TAXON_ID=2838 /ORGANISM="Odontella" /LENGTH=479 /DNA_ID=CAMNT_0000474957 /DNA_START=143 /DNA_END=1582 /DNA_ORIENTATION=- /assembly_acc=CAM_ASM_000160
MTTAGAKSKDRAIRTETGRSIADNLSARNIRVAVVGNVDAGKSTLIGTLTTQIRDDGRGKARSLIMRHAHELETGRTSTVSSNLLGFKENGDTIVCPGTAGTKKHRVKLEELIGREADRVVTLTDLAGHEKYLKTTIYGVSKGFADYALVLVNSRQPPTHMTLHHLNLCSAFGIPVIVVLTKIDGCPKHVLKSTKEEVAAMLRSPDVSKRPYTIRSEHDIETVTDKMGAVAPVVGVSCVTGDGMDLLRRVLFSVPKRRRHHEKKISKPLEYLVEDIFNVPGTGLVVSGFVNAGRLALGEAVFAGPLDDGSFLKTTVKSAHLARTLVGEVVAGDDACLALSLGKEQRKKLRPGMVVLRDVVEPVRKFEAEIYVVKGEGTTIRENYTTLVHVLHVRQAARVTDIVEVVDYRHFPVSRFGGNLGDGKDVVRPGCKARVTFEFLHRPEHIREGMRVIFRDSHVRGIGVITEVHNGKKAPPVQN